jgi:hypothetical protein
MASIPNPSLGNRQETCGLLKAINNYEWICLSIQCKCVKALRSVKLNRETVKHDQRDSKTQTSQSDDFHFRYVQATFEHFLIATISASVTFEQHSNISSQRRLKRPLRSSTTRTFPHSDDLRIRYVRSILNFNR